MKKIFLLIIVSLMLIVNVVGAETGKREVRLAYFTVAPQIYFDEKTGELTGAIYEFLEKHIAPEMNVKFVWDPQPTVIPRQVEIIEKQKDYASALLTYTPERAQKVIFAEKPYLISRPALAVLKSSKIDKIASIDDIDNIVIGYASQATIPPFLNHPKIKFDLISAPNFTEMNFKKLQDKRIDAVYMPGSGSLLYYMRKLNLEKECKVVYLPDNPTVISMAFNQNLKDVADNYNKVYKKLDGEKLFLKVLNKYLDTSKL